MPFCWAAASNSSVARLRHSRPSTTRTNASPNHVDIIGAAIKEKAAKPDPKPASLLVRCVFSPPVLEDEWAQVVKTLRERESKHAFREVVLIDHVGNRCTTLW